MNLESRHNYREMSILIEPFRNVYLKGMKGKEHISTWEQRAPVLAPDEPKRRPEDEVKQQTL